MLQRSFPVIYFIEKGDFVIQTEPRPSSLWSMCEVPERITKTLMLSDGILRFRAYRGFAKVDFVLPPLGNGIGRYEIEATSNWLINFIETLDGPHSRIRVPLAPLPEQHRIVAEIETQFTRLDATVTALQRVQANLKRYRASVLQAACTGRLVPTEAELARAEGRSYEPADQLLQRILQERRTKWEAEQLANMKAEGKVPKDDRWKSKYSEPVKPDTSELPELPEGWVMDFFRPTSQFASKWNFQKARWTHRIADSSH